MSQFVARAAGRIALEAAREKPMPDVYVFRKTQRPLYPDPDDEAQTQLFESQLKALRGFWGGRPVWLGRCLGSGEAQ